METRKGEPGTRCDTKRGFMAMDIGRGAGGRVQADKHAGNQETRCRCQGDAGILQMVFGRGTGVGHESTEETK